MLDLYSMSANPHPKTILRIEEVLHRTGLKRTMLYDLIEKEKFPKQFSLGARAVGWYEDEVENWIRNRQAMKPESERPDSIDEVTMPALKNPREGIRATTTLNPSQPKRSADPASIPPKPGAKKRSHAPTIMVEDDIEEAMNESEKLSLLRKENAQLKKLVGELVLKNSMLQSSVGLKTAIS